MDANKELQKIMDEIEHIFAKLIKAEEFDEGDVFLYNQARTRLVEFLIRATKDGYKLVKTNEKPGKKQKNKLLEQSWVTHTREA